MRETYQFTKANVDETCDAVYEYIVDYINDNGYICNYVIFILGINIDNFSLDFTLCTFFNVFN